MVPEFPSRDSSVLRSPFVSFDDARILDEVNSGPMEAAGFVLARIGDAHKLVASVRDRISNYRKGREAFTVLSDSVDSLARHIAEVDNIHGKFLLPYRLKSLLFSRILLSKCATLSRLRTRSSKGLCQGRLMLAGVVQWAESYPVCISSSGRMR